MEQNHDYEKACERYLLGELTEQEQAQLEEAYFTNDARFESFLAVKHDLIDAYARGDLSGVKRQRFEQNFLASGPRRQRVEEAKEFIRAVSAAPLKESIVNEPINSSTQSSDVPWWRSISNLFVLRPLVFRGAVAALLLLVVAGSWVLVRRYQRQQADLQELHQVALRQKEEELKRASASPVNENTSAPDSNVTSNLSDNRQPVNSTDVPKPGTVNKRPRQPASGQVASIFLLPFSARGDSDSHPLLLRSETRAVRLTLAFQKADYSRYEVVLRTAEGEQVLRRGPLSDRSNAAGRSVTLTLDPAIFRRRDYIVTLNGITSEGKPETVAEYYFHVKRETPQSTPAAVPR